jgi:hypothetical protein
MLNVAKSRGISITALIIDLYARLFEGDISENGPKLDADENLYNAIIIVGTFTEGHVNELAIPSLLRVLKSGGVLTASVKTLTWVNRSFQEYLDVKERENVFEIVDVMHGVDYLRGGDDPSSATVFTIRKP